MCGKWDWQSKGEFGRIGAEGLAGPWVGGCLSRDRGIGKLKIAWWGGRVRKSVAPEARASGWAFPDSGLCSKCIQIFG